MNPDIQDKINKIRESLGKDAHESSYAMVDQWEKDLRVIFENSQYLENPITQVLVADAKKQIDLIETKLLSDTPLSGIERDTLIAERKVFRWYLRLIDKDWKKIEGQIEESVNASLEDAQ